MLTGDTVSQCRVIGPADPTPTHATRTPWRSAWPSCCSTMPASALKWASGPAFWSTSTTARSSSSPRGVTSPAANLVPPMSTARTTGGSFVGAVGAALASGSGRVSAGSGAVGLVVFVRIQTISRESYGRPMTGVIGGVLEALG